MVYVSSCAHELGCIESRTAADSKHNVDLLCLADSYALAYRTDSWVWLDARELEKLEAGLLDLFNNLVIEAHALDRTAAVCEENAVTEALELCSEV